MNYCKARRRSTKLRFHQDKGKGKLFTLTNIPPQMEKKASSLCREDGEAGCCKLFVLLINEPLQCSSMCVSVLGPVRALRGCKEE